MNKIALLMTDSIETVVTWSLSATLRKTVNVCTAAQHLHHLISLGIIQLSRDDLCDMICHFIGDNVFCPVNGFYQTGTSISVVPDITSDIDYYGSFISAQTSLFRSNYIHSIVESLKPWKPSKFLTVCRRILWLVSF